MQVTVIGADSSILDFLQRFVVSHGYAVNSQPIPACAYPTGPATHHRYTEAKETAITEKCVL